MPALLLLNNGANVRIVLYNLNYMPELTGIGKYVFELACWLAGRGHEVTVICSQPYYPNWKVFDGYKSFHYRRQVLEGVVVYRCPIWVPARPSGIKRIFHLLSFAFSSAPVLFYCLSKRPAVVFLTVPTFFCSFATVLSAKLFRVKAWMHVQDFEVDAAFSMGLLKGELKRKLAFLIEHWVYKGFDKVSTISSRMMEVARRKGVSDSDLFYFPNWAPVLNGTPQRSEVSSVDYKKKLGIPVESIVSLYSGNMGEKQGLDILAEVAVKLRDESELYFIFCGNGAGRLDLEVRCEGLKNVRFLDLQPIENLSELLQTADIHLLPQRADAADLVMPSKLTGMLASGRAIVATAHLGTEVATVVDGCGMVVPPDDADRFSAAVLMLARDSSLRASFGRAGRCYAERYLDQGAVMCNFEAELKRLV